MAQVKTIAQQAMRQIRELVQKKPLAVIAVEKEGTRWKALVEVLERKAIPDTQDIIGVYEILLTDSGELSSYKQVEKRHRGMPYSQKETAE